MPYRYEKYPCVDFFDLGFRIGRSDMEKIRVFYARFLENMLYFFHIGSRKWARGACVWRRAGVGLRGENLIWSPNHSRTAKKSHKEASVQRASDQEREGESRTMTKKHPPDQLMRWGCSLRAIFNSFCSKRLSCFEFPSPIMSMTVLTAS